MPREGRNQPPCIGLLTQGIRSAPGPILRGAGVFRPSWEEGAFRMLVLDLIVEPPGDAAHRAAAPALARRAAASLMRLAAHGGSACGGFPQRSNFGVSPAYRGNPSRR
jgi:hypothetical protein